MSRAFWKIEKIGMFLSVVFDFIRCHGNILNDKDIYKYTPGISIVSNLGFSAISTEVSRFSSLFAHAI